jgi:hypothetical protein
VIDLKVIHIIENFLYIRQETSNMVTSYPSTNVTLVATMMMVLMIYLSMCGMFDNVAATSTNSFFQRKRATVTINNALNETRNNVLNETINNALNETIQLQAACESDDDNLGQHQISLGANYSFTFRPDIFKGTSFMCNFSWNLNSSYSSYLFEIYHQKRDRKICRACAWKIKIDGPCEYNYVTKDYDICYDWTS